MKYSTLIQGEGVLLSHEQLLLKLAPGGLPDSLLPGGPRLCQDAADRTPPLASLGTASLRHDGGWLLRRPGTGFKGAFHRLKSCLAVLILLLAAVADGATRLAGGLRVLRNGVAAQQGRQPGTAGSGHLVGAAGAAAAEALEGIATSLLLPEPLLHNVLQARQLPALSQFLKVFELLLAVGQVQGYMALDVLQDRRELGPAAQQQGPPQCVCALKSVPKKGALNYLILNLYGPIEQADDCGVAEQLLLGL